MSNLAKIHLNQEPRWYPVPPYSTSGEPQAHSWTIVNECGELVATFETREDCEAAALAYNARIEQ